MASALVNLIKGEPAVLLAVVAAGAGFGVTHGLHMNANDTKAVESAVTVLTGVAIRQFVTPTHKVTAVNSVAQSVEDVQARLRALEALVGPTSATAAAPTAAPAALLPPPATQPPAPAEQSVQPAPPAAASTGPPAQPSGWRLL